MLLLSCIFLLQLLHLVSSQGLIVGLVRDLLTIPKPFITRVDFQTDRVCYDELGCFGRGGYFEDARHRPISVVPESREKINTQFYLYTRSNPTQPYHLNRTIHSIRNSPFRVNRPTKILVHGFLFSNILGKYQQESFEILQRAYLKAGDYNVIQCDWGDGASTWYFQASANSRVVGAEIASLLNYLSRVTGMRMQDAHVIGHSLGAHIAGYAGEGVRNLGRITALDPAKPYFEATHPSVRLDPTDALYVDVVHSDASTKNGALFSLGTRQLMGDVDFFPNNGDVQPDCDTQPIRSLLSGAGVVPTIRDTVACDHRRSVELLSDYLERRYSKKCFPLAYKCTSWTDYMNGLCYSCGANGENCAIVGEPKVVHDKWAQKYPFYIKTSRQSPLCAFQYRIEFNLRSEHRNAVLRITIFGDNENNQVSETTDTRDWLSDTQYAVVIAGQSNIRFISAIEIAHVSIDNLRLSTVEVKFASAMPMNEWSDNLKRRLTVKMCDFEDQATRSNTCYL